MLKSLICYFCSRLAEDLLNHVVGYGLKRYHILCRRVKTSRFQFPSDGANDRFRAMKNNAMMIRVQMLLAFEVQESADNNSTQLSFQAYQLSAG
jgi:hypothetical protein